MHSTFDIHFTVCDMILVFYEALSVCDLDNSAFSSFILQYLYYDNDRKANVCLIKVVSVCCSCSPYSVYSVMWCTF